MAIYKCNIKRISNGKEEIVSSEELVPGDVVELSNDLILPCDITLLSGQCIVNESMLTGESLPVVKNALPVETQKIYSVDDDKTYTLYSGTKLIQARETGSSKVVGFVARTGFHTSKGKLVLSILYPKPNTFAFYTDSFKFIGVMFIIGMLGFTYSAVQMALLQVGIKKIIIRALDIITITVPPALPIAMTIGTSFAINRLMEKKIFCISPPRINVSGMIEFMCFDKTGTLTQEGLDLNCVIPTSHQVFQNSIYSPEIATMDQKDVQYSVLLSSLSTCHGLCQVNHEVIGDPLEIQIFRHTKWHLNDEINYGEYHSLASISNPKNDRNLLVLKRFDFSSALQRMSVLVKEVGMKGMVVYSKGSPEMLKTLCDKNSLPNDYDKVLLDFAKLGYRVLAIAYNPIQEYSIDEIKQLSRDDVEKDLTFLGFIIMENKLKMQTKGVIKELRQANIHNVMITGDNPHTAISVGRKSCLISENIAVYLGDVENGKMVWKDVESDDTLDPVTLEQNLLIKTDYLLAITGQGFKEILKSHERNNPNPLVFKVLKLCKVYSRMSPDQKMRLIEEFEDLDIFTGMCGDGANDCGALKTAHVGISLSESEASIAAPFTSLRSTIECVPHIIREGRAALVTSLQVFKYMAAFSLVSFFSVVLLYRINANFGDFQFLFIDIFIILPVAFLSKSTLLNFSGKNISK